MRQIMTIDRADVIESHFLEQCTASNHTAREFVDHGRRFADLAGEFIRHFLGHITSRAEWL